MRIPIYTFLFSALLISCGVNNVSPDLTGNRPDRVGSRHSKLAGIESSGAAYSDTFIDSISENDGLVFSLNVIAPVKPKPVIVVYDTIQVFAVQLKAFAEESAAIRAVEDLKKQETDSVFYYEEGMLFKVRVGPYHTRVEADEKRNSYKKGEYSGAWVAPHLIIRTGSVETTELEKSTLVNSNEDPRSGIFYVQIASTRERNYAEDFIIRNSPVNGHKPEIFKKNDQYKIVLGPFESKNAAEKALIKIRNYYPDAWIISK